MVYFFAIHLVLEEHLCLPIMISDLFHNTFYHSKFSKTEQSRCTCSQEGRVRVVGVVSVDYVGVGGIYFATDCITMTL